MLKAESIRMTEPPNPKPAKPPSPAPEQPTPPPPEREPEPEVAPYEEEKTHVDLPHQNPPSDPRKTVARRRNAP
jgi:hypothetical protein